MRPSPLALVLAATLLAAAPAGAKSLFDDIKGAFSSDESDEGGAKEEGEKSRLEEFKADPGDGPCGGDGVASLLHARVEQGFGVIDAPGLNAYLNAVLAKLVAVSPRTDCKVRVRVTPHNTAQAVALADGGILLAIGFLRNLKNEDEAAALLAHELVHVLRGHHSSDAFVDTQDDLLKGMDSVNVAGGMLLGVVDPGLKDTLDAATSIGGAVYSVSENMIAPAWTRDQEDEADLIGADLMAEAGYNPSAMGKIMDVIASHEAEAAKVEEAKAELRKERLKDTAIEAAQETNTSSVLSILSSIAKVTVAAVETATEGKKTHRPAAERKDSINAYVRKHHRKARRRQYADEPWLATLELEIFRRYKAASEARRLVHGGGDASDALAKAKSAVEGATAGHAYPRLALSEARLKSGNREGALNALRYARKRADAPWQIYRAQADLQLGTGDVKAAVATVAAADQALGQPLGIAPFAIKIYRRAGDSNKVKYYLDRCDDAGKREHLDICLAEAGISKEQYKREKLLR